MAGRPKFEITPDIIKRVEVYAAQGLTQEQIARCLGICYQTLNEKKKEYSDFSEAIKAGRAKGLAIISNALFVGAKGGNTTAQIFYLKNRGPEDWKDRRETVLQGDEEHPLFPTSVNVNVVKPEDT